MCADSSIIEPFRKDQSGVYNTSMKKYNRSLFIFRRDLRLQDNIGLIRAMKESEEVVLAFIFTPKQLKNNPYYGNASVQFMIESLKDLENDVKKKNGTLHYFYDQPEEVVSRVIKKGKVDAVFINRDYTPYAVARDAKMKKSANELKCDFIVENDALLTAPEQVQSGSGDPYKVFSAFLKTARNIRVAKPQKVPKVNFKKVNFPTVKLSSIQFTENKHLAAKGEEAKPQRFFVKWRSLKIIKRTGHPVCGRNNKALGAS